MFHVNADDVEALNFVCQMAADWRAEFQRDVVVDIVCYRKHGHNETDQPSFTQPLMYKRIEEHRSQLTQYVEKLLAEKTFTKDDIDEHKKWVWGMLEESFERGKDYTPSAKEWLTSAWNGFKSPKELATEVLPHLPTGVSAEALRHIGDVIATPPKDFNVHKNLKRILAGRKKTVDEGKAIDWSTGRGAGLWEPGGRWAPCARVRAGRRAWHLLAAPRGAARSGDGNVVHAAAARQRGPGGVCGFELVVERVWRVSCTEL